MCENQCRTDPAQDTAHKYTCVKNICVSSCSHFVAMHFPRTYFNDVDHRSHGRERLSRRTCLANVHPAQANKCVCFIARHSCNAFDSKAVSGQSVLHSTQCSKTVSARVGRMFPCSQLSHCTTPVDPGVRIDFILVLKAVSGR